MLTDAEIADMRQVQESAMPQSMTVLRITTESDGLGGRIQTETVFGPYPCRLAPLRGQEILEADGARALAEGYSRLSYAFDVAIYEQDEVTVGGVTYSVVAIEEDRDWKTAGRALIRRKE